MARALLERWASAKESRDAEKNLGVEAGSLGELPEDVVARIEAAGLSYGPGFAIGDDRRPSDRAAVREALRGRYESWSRAAVMNLLSGHAHGTLWALLQSFAQTGEQVEDEWEYQLFADQRVLDGMAGVATACFVAGATNAVQLFGWGRIPIDCFAATTDRLRWEGSG